MNKHLFFLIFSMHTLTPMETPFLGQKNDSGIACFDCNKKLELLDEGLGRCNTFLYSENSKCAHTVDDVTQHGYCLDCERAYKSRKADLLERQNKIIADLPLCFASAISPEQLQFAIANPTNNKYHLRYRPDSGRKELILFHKEIFAQQTIPSDTLDVCKNVYSFNIKKYCPESGAYLPSAFIGVLLKEHAGFSWTQSRQEGNVTTFVEHKIPMQFNAQDRYELTLTLAEHHNDAQLSALVKKNEICTP